MHSAMRLNEFYMMTISLSHLVFNTSLQHPSSGPDCDKGEVKMGGNISEDLHYFLIIVLLSQIWNNLQPPNKESRTIPQSKIKYIHRTEKYLNYYTG